MTVICPLADSYISDAARDAGAAAELTASRKDVKYGQLKLYTLANTNTNNTNPNPNPSLTLNVCAIVDVAPAAPNTI